MLSWITRPFKNGVYSQRNEFSTREVNSFLKYSLKYSQLMLSPNRRDPLKHFEKSVHQHIRFADLRKIPIETTKFHKWTCNVMPLVRNIHCILKILWERREIPPKEQFLLLSTIFYYLMLDFCVKTRIRFCLRHKRLFEIIEVEITRVDCSFPHLKWGQKRKWELFVPRKCTQLRYLQPKGYFYLKILYQHDIVTLA